jgi:hypothetical protein
MPIEVASRPGITLAGCCAPARARLDGDRLADVKVIYPLTDEDRGELLKLVPAEKRGETARR